MKLIKKLDIYIIKKFLGTYIFAIILILAIVVMFDIIIVCIPPLPASLFYLLYAVRCQLTVVSSSLLSSA